MPEARSLWYRFVQSLVQHVVYRALGGIQVEGRENIPMEGPLLFAPNHVSVLDPPLVGCLVPRLTWFMAKEELFRNRVVGGFIRSIRAMPVRRGESDTAAIRKTLEILGHNEAVLIFPEGTRSDGTELLPIKAGIGMLASRGKAKVVPVAVVGTHRVLPRGQSKPRRGPMKVVFGKPLDFEQITAGLPEREGRQRFADVLANAIADLCTQSGLPLKTAPSNALPAASPAAGTAPAEPGS